MGSIRRIEKQNNQDVDLDKIIDEYSSYIKTVINNMAGKNLSYEDKEEVLIDTFFIFWKNKTSCRLFAPHVRYILSYSKNQYHRLHKPGLKHYHKSLLEREVLLVVILFCSQWQRYALP